MLGGCSSHNGGIALMPLDLDMQRWQKMGAEGWTHDDMVRLTRKLRNNIVPVHEKHRSPIVKDWVKTCADVFGVPIIEDFNAGIARHATITFSPDQAQQATASPKKHTKSRFGCKECKLRRVKCDQTHPVCIRCQRRGSVCFSETDPTRCESRHASHDIQDPCRPVYGGGRP